MVLYKHCKIIFQNLFNYILFCLTSARGNYIIITNLVQILGAILLNKMKYILDIGSSALRLLAVSNFAGKSRIIAEESVLYDGYIDGEFLTPESFCDKICTLFQNMSDKTRKQISSVVIGVPSDFCICVCKRITRKFATLHKVKNEDILDLFNSNASFGDSNQYSVINFSPIQCVLDGEVKTLSPVGKSTMGLVLDASYILAKTSFINFVFDVFKNLNIDKVDFISTALGQAMVCEPKKNVSRPFAIVDCGHITTSVAVFKGEGLATLSSFSMGGGHISSDIMQVLGKSFKASELIKRKVILTIDSVKNDNYEVCASGDLIKAPINITNQIVKSRIEMIAKVVSNILSIDKMFENIDIYLTGDGLTNFKGVKNIFKDVTGRDTYEFKIPFDNTPEKYQTSKIGLIALLDKAR